MKKSFVFTLYFILACAISSHAVQAASATEEAAIRQTALDYSESWYAGDGERRATCVHPQFAKRRVLDGEKVDHLDRQKMVELTKAKMGTDTEKEKQVKDVTILDIYESMASVKVVSAEFVDYLHLAKVEGRWVIINALWDFK
jgi:HD superfamily phosphodiesterase